jgi:hypothetical protein
MADSAKGSAPAVVQTDMSQMVCPKCQGDPLPGGISTGFGERDPRDGEVIDCYACGTPLVYRKVWDIQVADAKARLRAGWHR